MELGYLYMELKILVNETKDNGRENTTFNMGCNVGNKPNLEEIDRNNNKKLMDVIGLMQKREELNLNIDCIRIENKINHQVRINTKKLRKINGSDEEEDDNLLIHLSVELECLSDKLFSYFNPTSNVRINGNFIKDLSTFIFILVE